MDENSSRGAVKGHPDLRRVSASVPKMTARSISQTAQLVNQLGCSNRSNIAKSKIICSESLNISKPSYRYAESGKRVVGGSSWSSSSSNSSTRCLWEPQRKLSPKVDKVWRESASSSGSSDGSIVHESEVTKDILQSKNHDTVCTSTQEVILNTVSSPIARPQKNVIGKPEVTDLAGSSGSSSSRSKITYSTIPRFSQSSSKYVSKRPMESRINKRMELPKKGNVEGDNSYSGEKKTNPLRIGENSGSAHGKSITKLRKQLHYSGWDTDVASVSSQRSRLPIFRVKPSTQEYGSNSTPNESNVIIQHVTAHEVPVTISTSSMSHTDSSRNFMAHPITGGNPASSSDLGVTTGMVNQGGSPHQMEEGINEILLALERIGQMSYERSLFLEMNSFLSGLSFHDQHRDMRLDIDNMSYEELLALEDRIGSVSTALTEEAMDKCLNKSFYKPSPSEVASISLNKDEDNLKCCICQEEYVVGDEVGRLHCEHLYHSCCIHQWLGQKNWCPICKKSAVPP